MLRFMYESLADATLSLLWNSIHLLKVNAVAWFTAVLNFTISAVPGVKTIGSGSVIVFEESLASGFAMYVSLPPAGAAFVVP